MAGWQDELRALAASLGSRIRRGTNALERLVDHDPYHIVGYRGYATDHRVLLLGRVLQNEGQSEPEPSHSKLRNLVAMLKRLESDPLPFAQVRARLPGGDRELIADDEGFIRYWVALDAPPPSGWGSIPLELHDPAGGVSSAGRALYLTPPASAAFGIISDMDDTVLQSHVTDFIRAARMVLLENARTRLPFPGVAAFYRALQEGGTGGAGNPIFYVSSSPWNLYDVVEEFLEAQQIPAGPLLLRDWDLGLSVLRNAAYKTGVIREILTAYPSLPFILVGDSGQEDPEIYADIVATHPGRILAAYIRSVRQDPERSPAIRDLAERVSRGGSTLVLADDTLAVARHAAAHGWIRDSMLSEIGEEKRADEGGGGKEPAPGVDETPAAPTLVVDQNVDARELD
ncbi:MAG TPA: phosphatase domain-containing protein [Gemmatimonadales bacterium]|nr:phosphatase domain-containing protein [Gemmatimonadales bacterium]